MEDPQPSLGVVCVKGEHHSVSKHSCAVGGVGGSKIAWLSKNSGAPTAPSLEKEIYVHCKFEAPLGKNTFDLKW